MSKSHHVVLKHNLRGGGGGELEANSHSFLIRLDFYIWASLLVCSQRDTNPKEETGGSNKKKKRLLEMNVPSWIQRERGFRGSCLLPRPNGETLEGAELAGSMPPLGLQVSVPAKGRSDPQSFRPSATVFPSHTLTHRGLCPSAPLAQREVGGDLRAFLWSGSHRSHRAHSSRRTWCQTPPCPRILPGIPNPRDLIQLKCLKRKGERAFLVVERTTASPLASSLLTRVSAT